ncbi:MAG: hypothetical protein PHX38_01285 [Sulfuricella sp.]|nr:hypothetical protein [Sulfuricella sp.]
MNSLPISAANRASAAAWLVGAAGAAALFFHADYGGQAFAPSWLFAWLFFLGLSLGGMALVLIHNLTGGAWAEPVRPLFEGALRLFPLSALLAVPLLFRLPELYPWMRPADPELLELVRHKAWYLNDAFFGMRAAIYFSIWIALARLLRAPPAGAASVRAVSSAGFILYALTTTFAAIDWIMSITPQWRSTGFGLLVGAGQTLAALAGAVAGAAWSGRGGRDALHDLGNLLLVLVMVWAYLAFMQFLIIWMEDLPDEIAWYAPRLQTSWRGLALFLVLANLVLPFLALLSRGVKRSPRALAAVAGVLLFACLADTFWLVMPSLRPDGFSLEWNDLFALLAVGGIWLGGLLRGQMRAPIPAEVADHG